MKFQSVLAGLFLMDSMCITALYRRVSKDGD